jgi:hypothetical protein
VRSIAFCCSCIILATACGSSESTADSATPVTVDAALLDTFTVTGPVPAPAAEFTPPCLDTPPAGIGDGSSIVYENEALSIGALRLSTDVADTADAGAYVDLWRGDPFGCLPDSAMSSRSDATAIGDGAVRWSFEPDSGSTLSQELVVTHLGAAVVIVSLTSEGEAPGRPQVEELLRALVIAG